MTPSQINQQKQRQRREQRQDAVSNPELKQFCDLIEKAKHLGVTLDVRFTDREKELLGRRWVKWLARKGIPKDYGWWLNWIGSQSKNPAAGAIALRDLCTLADRHGRVIRLDVLHADPKLIRLYKKFGFKLIDNLTRVKPCCGNPNPAKMRDWCDTRFRLHSRQS